MIVGAPAFSVLAVLILAAGAPLVLLTGLRSSRFASALAQGTALAAAGLGALAVAAGSHGSWALPVLRLEPPGSEGSAGVEFGARTATTPTVSAVAVTVLAVVLAVQVYAGWYLRDDRRRPAFMATVSLFAAAMLLLILSRDLVLTLVGWEVMGWCSYLLIGHWSGRATARRAAYKAFLVTRLADAAFVLGVVALIAIAGSSDIDAISDTIGARVATCATASGCRGPADLAMTALVVGVLGKSAQIPFQDWLIDAMEGPTPASALIHAATMVAAGTWVLVGLAPVLQVASVASWVLAVSVAATMAYAGFTAFFQSDVKRILAWSTISQIAVMLSPLAVAATADAGAAAATGHLFSHAIFKALLFLTVGWLAVLSGSTAARALDGAGADSWLARGLWGLGLISLAGVPLTVGGISKEHVIDVASWREGGAPGVRQGLVTLALLLTVALTAAYATRAYEIVAGRGADRAPNVLDEPAQRAHQGNSRHADAGPVVKSVLVLLALATLAGSLVFRYGPLDPGTVDVPLLAVTVGLIAVGVVLAWYLRPDDQRPPGRVATLADNGFGADRAYVRGIADPVLGMARAAAYLDREVVETYVRGTAAGAGLLARGSGWLHTRERVSTNLVWVVLGLLLVAGAALCG